MDKCALFVFLARQEKTKETFFWPFSAGKVDFAELTRQKPEEEEEEEKKEVYVLFLSSATRKERKETPLKGKRRYESRLSG